jgi:hypothetical protein
MEVVAAVLGMVAVALVVLVVSAPLRGGHEQAERADALRAADLEAAKEAKYREIRDVELDFRTGKLPEEEFRAQDRRLRGEAAALLRELDGLG